MLEDRQAALERENAELRRQLDVCHAELNEAREQQTATAEVLQVINASPGDLAPVFDAILEKAHSLCGAAYGSLQLWDGEKFRAVAVNGFSEVMAEALRQGYIPGPNHPCRRLFEGERAAHCIDLAEVDDPVTREGGVKIGGIRTVLYVALRKDDVLLGQIVAARREVRPFSEKEVALVENFAAQAVIAMENARLLTETREALEQQTATAEVLQVINSSPGDLAPVFDAMLKRATRLCEATHGHIWSYDGESFHPATAVGEPEFVRWFEQRGPVPPQPGGDGFLGRVAPGELVLYIADVRATEAYRSGDATVKALADLSGGRSVITVALRTEAKLLGAITIYRQEVRAFTDKQIALLQNFAAQAVIAMENARLITETREALEQQTATAEVLQVINSSPGDLAPVFNVILEKAHNLCGSTHGSLFLRDGDHFRPAAMRGVPERFAERLRRGFRGSEAIASQPLLAGEPVVHIMDMAQFDHPMARAAVELAGARTLLSVPLRKGDELFGLIVATRFEVRAFTDKQISLLQNFAAQAVIAMENARLLTETREALEQQTATAEVLQVINSSPGDLTPVFDAILDKAHSLCGVDTGSLQIFDGEYIRAVAVHGRLSAVAEELRRPRRSTDSQALQRMLTGEPFAQVTDFSKEFPRSVVARAGVRTVLYVALRQEKTLLGFIAAGRSEVRPFTEKQIALLQNFAAQAVIAMENARLLTETREALEQQTATAEVLQVINSSPGDLAPVFDAMLEEALRHCDGALGQLWTYDGDCFEMVASRGVPAALAEFLSGRQRMSPETTHGRLAAGEHLVHVTDLADSETYRSGNPHRKMTVDVGGAHSLLGIALRHEEKLLGALMIYRQEVRPFSDREIALLQNFAAQAVVAMENARLLTETREALEQQTATAEVLQVINSSPGDLTPVFDAMLEKAIRLCEATHGQFFTYDGERFHPAVVRSEQRYIDWTTQIGPISPAPNTPLGQLSRGEQIVHTADVREEEFYRTVPNFRELADLRGVRSQITVALLKDNILLGAMIVYRQQVRPFSDKQIALLQNFAAQAVIAMENARLITETREALEQQTATAEVLQVINSSPGDLAPVFDAMLEKALRLCEAAYGNLLVFDGRLFSFASVQGEPDLVAHMRRREPFEPMPGTALSRIVAGEDVAEIFDLLKSHEYHSVPQFRELVDIGGYRSLFEFALRKDKALLGVIAIFRREGRPFTDKQIALLQNFAAQAVIAMENARLLTETREALEQQTATAEVLQVINSSPGDLVPVFDAILEKAHTLCGAAHGHLTIYDGEHFRAVATHGMPAQFAELVRQPFRPGHDLAERLLGGEPIFHIPDMAALTLRPEDKIGHAAVELGGARTLLAVPLRKDHALLGYITAHRQEVKPFSDKQIALLQNFAVQAVIAMENARLLGELRQRTGDLQESLEYQTAISDVLKVISRSAFDLQTVLQAVVVAAIRLCRADTAVIYRNEDGDYRWAAGEMLLPEYEKIEREIKIRPGMGTVVGRAAIEGRTVQILDAWTDPFYEAKDDARIGGIHTLIGVPLLRENAPIGVIGLARRRVEAFSEREIALVTTFADQAVIAIENARLIDELRARTAELGRSVEELKMLSEVSQAVSSTLDLRVVLSKILTASLGVTWANAGAIFRYIRAERAFRLVEAVGWDEALRHSVGDLRIAEAETAMGEATATRTPIQIVDLAERPSAPLRDASLAAGFHSALIVPLVGAERVFGAIVLMRQQAGEFPAETVRLTQTLASQSVLAIQNARLFREIADKSEQLALASQHKSQFLANMSHELRTPLNAILGYAELLADGIYGVLPEKAQGVLERVQNNGQHLLALINDVLDLAKIEAGQLTLTIEDYLVAEVVRSVVTATEPLAAAKALKFTANVQDNMPMAHGDARRVSQVLLNLVGNAIKFTDNGEIGITASVADSQLVLEVRDTGPGIADADQERIFDEFQQIDNTSTRKKGGTGLGLAISKRMVEIQGGMISVNSAVGRGSTFRVVLPVHVEPALEEAA